MTRPTSERLRWLAISCTDREIELWDEITACRAERDHAAQSASSCAKRTEEWRSYAENLREAFGLATERLGIAYTWLEFHGTETVQKKTCCESLERWEEQAREALSLPGPGEGE